MKIHIITYGMVLTMVSLYAKEARGQDPIFSQFFSSPMYLNPAFAGTDHCTRLVFNYRNQPYPDFGTFSTFNFSYDNYFRGVSGGIGFLATSDHQGGLVMRNHLSTIYSYHLQAGRDLYLNFGAQAGYYRKDLSWDKLVFADQLDPVTGETLPQTEDPPDQTYKHSVNFATGILLYSERFYGGIAAHHLNRPEESFFGNQRTPLKFTAHVGMQLSPFGRSRYSPTREEFFVSPNVIFQNQGDFYRINYGFYAGFEQFVVGTWFRQNLKFHDSLIFLLGLKQENYRIGYSYDYSLSGFSGNLQGAHEISVSLNLHCEDKNMKRRILNCPTF